MYSNSSDAARRPTDTAPLRPEPPILFHLADVSRPRVSDAASACAPAPEPVPLATTEALLPLSDAEKEALQGVVAHAVGATASPPLLVAKPLLLAPPPDDDSRAPSFRLAPSALIEITARSEPPPTQQKATQATSSPTAKHAEPLAGALQQTITEPQASAAPVEQPTVSLKSKTSDRRRRKTTPSEDWFTYHGKFIALAFVVALIGTVYFARTNRRQPAPAKNETAALSPLVEFEVPTAKSEATSVQSIAAVSDSKVELQPPTSPPLISSTSSDKSGPDKLFEFPAARRPEEHVAARPAVPESPRQQAGPANTPASPSKESKETSNDAGPALAPAYPVTNSSPPAYPTSTYPTSTYPTSTSPQSNYAPTTPPPLAGAGYGIAPQGYAPPGYGPPAGAPPPQYAAGAPAAAYQPGYRNEYPPAAAAAPSGWAPPSQAVPPGQYQPTDYTARGPRYERTGSSPY